MHPTHLEEVRSLGPLQALPSSAQFSPLPPPPPLVLLSSQSICVPFNYLCAAPGRGRGRATRLWLAGRPSPLPPSQGSAAFSLPPAGRGWRARPVSGEGPGARSAAQPGGLPAPPQRPVPCSRLARCPPLHCRGSPRSPERSARMAAAAERGSEPPAEPPRGARRPPLGPEEVARRPASTRREPSDRRQLLAEEPAGRDQHAGTAAAFPQAAGGVARSRRRLRRAVPGGGGAAPQGRREGGAGLPGGRRLPSSPGELGGRGLAFLPATGPLGLLLPTPSLADGFVTASSRGACGGRLQLALPSRWELPPSSARLWEPESGRRA